MDASEQIDKGDEVDEAALTRLVKAAIARNVGA